MASKLFLLHCVSFNQTLTMKQALITIVATMLCLVTCTVYAQQTIVVEHASPQIYLQDQNRLDEIIRAESQINKIILYGYRGDDFYQATVTMGARRVFSIRTFSHPFQSRYWRPMPLSIITTPFKVRPAVGDAKRVASAAVNNIGVNVDLLRFTTDRFFTAGTRATHRGSIGLWIAPSVEEVDSITTDGYLGKTEKSKQLFVSTAISISYTYNNFTFTFMPLGWDIATSTVGKNWIYNKERWWGFGIGIDTKILAQILSTK